MKEEVWKEFYRRESARRVNIFEISTEGRIRNATTGIIRKPNIVLGYRYFQDTYWVDGVAHYFRESIHRLVAKTFIPNPDNLPVVDHINGDRSNNTVGNLRWVTEIQNSNNPVTKKNMIKSRQTRGFYIKTPIVLLLEKQIPL